MLEDAGRSNIPEPTIVAGTKASSAGRSDVGSVLAAFFGVQSNRARERDFTKGKPSTYIILGIVLTIVFILVIFGVVKLVLSLAGV